MKSKKEMLFEVPLTPKHTERFHGEINLTTPVPENWADRVTQTKILSGGNEINFVSYPYQVKIAELMRDYSCIFIKSRQCGLSTVTLSFLIHQAGEDVAQRGHFKCYRYKIGGKQHSNRLQVSCPNIRRFSQS